MRKSQREKRAKYFDEGSEGALSSEHRAPEQRQSDEPMTASTMSICKKENTERKTEIKIKERETEKESERKKSEIP